MKRFGWLLVLLTGFAQAQISGGTLSGGFPPQVITGLPTGSALGGTEKIPMVQSGATVTTTPGAINTYVNNANGIIFVTDAIYGAKCNGSVDDTTAIQTAITAASNGSTIRFPDNRTCIITSTINITNSGVILLGGGPLSTVLTFRPTTNGPMFQFSKGGSEGLSNGISELSIQAPSDTTHTKTAISLIDQGSFVLNNVLIGSWTGGSAITNECGTTDVQAGSVGLRICGRDNNSFSNLKITADRTIVITPDPNISTETLDHNHFYDLTLNNIAGVANPLIWADNGTILTNNTFDGHQAWIGGTAGFCWVDTTSIRISYANHFSNVRWEQNQTASGTCGGYAIYLSGYGSEGIHSTVIDNFYNAAGTAPTSNGIYCHYCSQTFINTMTQLSNQVAFTFDSTDYNVEWTNVELGSSSTMSMTGQSLVTGTYLYPNTTVPYAAIWSNSGQSDQQITNNTYYLTPTGANDEVPINAAIAAVCTAGGGTVQLAAGTFKTSHEIVDTCSTAYIHLIGAGKNSTIVQPTSSWVYTTYFCAIAAGGANGFEVSGIGVDWSKPAAQGDGFCALTLNMAYVTPSQNISFHDNNVAFQNQAGYMYWCQNCQHTHIFNNTGDGAWDKTSVYDQSGLEVFGGTDVEVNGNYISNIGSHAFLVFNLMDTVPNNSLLHIHVHHNRADSVKYGLTLTGSYDATNGPGNITDVIFDHNTITNVYFSGIVITPTSATVSKQGNALNQPVWKGVVFDNNEVNGAQAGYSTTSSGLIFYGSTAASSLVITSLTIASPVVFTTATHNFVVGQYVYIAGMQGVKLIDGIYTVNTTPLGTTFTLKKNGSVVNLGTGAYVASSAYVTPLITNYESVDITNNKFLDFQGTTSVANIYISGVGNVTFSGNTVRNTTPVATYHIATDNTYGGFVYNLTVDNNTFDGNNLSIANLKDISNGSFSNNTLLNWNLAGGSYAGLNATTDFDTNMLFAYNRFYTLNITGGYLMNISSANNQNFYLVGNSYRGYQPAGNDYNLPATPLNFNIGTVTGTNASPTITVTTNQCHINSNVTFVQSGGTINGYVKQIVPAMGSFVVTLSANSDGTDTWKWQCQ